MSRTTTAPPAGEFRAFQKVLVREGPGSVWEPALYAAPAVTGHRVVMCSQAFAECVPYEGNEHMAFTTIDPHGPSPFTGAQVVAVSNDEHGPWMLRLYHHGTAGGLHVTEDPDTGKRETWQFCRGAETVWNCTIGRRQE